MTPEMARVVDRLERLERENRRLRWGGLFVLGLLGILCVTGLTLDDPVIGAEAFTLLDTRGEPRGVFALVNEEPTLAFFDTQGRVRAGVSLVEDSPRIVLYDEGGNAVWTAPPPPRPSPGGPR